MSDHEQDSNFEMYEDSPPTSPNRLSSPEQQDSSNRTSSDVQSSSNDNSSEFENLSNDSSPNCATRTSPPSSPVRHGQKRSAYAAYKDDPSLPIPRQTVERWKKMRVEGHSNDSGSETSTGSQGSETKVSDNASLAEDAETNDFREASQEATCNPPQDVFDNGGDISEISESEEESDSSESGESASHDELNLSFDSISGGDSDVYCDLSDDSELDSNCGDDPFESLYPGCEMSKDEAIYDLMRVYFCNKLTKTALSDFLHLYVKSLPASHAMPRTIYHLFKYVKNLALPLNEKEHFYCRSKNAMHSVSSELGPCDCGSVDIGVFYELPLENAVQFLFEQRGLADVIDKYSRKRSERNENISDIVDGSEYKRVWTSVTSKYKLTLILNTDGVSPHASSKARFWPLMFTIMEVPPHLRSSFTIVWGIWFDKKFKPDMNLYLKPFVSSLVKIHEDGGIHWKHPATGITYASPIRVPIIVADAPARAAVLNMQEHQAKYACNTCEQKTSKLPAPPTLPGEKRKRRLRRFVFKENAAKLRTHQRILKCGKIAERDTEPKRGVKGTTVLQGIPFIDLSSCVLAEYMHGVLCGVVKQISSLWFFEPGPWYIGDHIKEMDQFLTEEIHPPDFVTRLPRTFDNFCYFKANEFRSYLLYFSLVIVAPYLKEEFHQHWILFVQAIYLLLLQSISETDFETAETLLRLFVRDIGTLYGNKHFVFNVHQLQHLVLYARRFGPLWSNSAFSFEDLNGILVAMVHGSKNEGRELLNQLSLVQGHQMLRNKIVSDTSKSKAVSVSGKLLSRMLNDLELRHLQKMNVNTDSYQCYSRVKVGREIFTSQEYDKQFKRRNSYVEVNHDGKKVYGRITFFCKCADCVLCFVSVCKVVHTKFFFHKTSMTRIAHIIPFEDSEDLVVCDVKDVVQKLIQVGNYLCIRPNSVERNL